MENTPLTEVGLSPKELKRYSVARVIKAQMPGTRVDASFEREVSDAIAKKLGSEPRGMYVPFEVQRDWNLGESVQGGYLVADEHRPGSFIELLRDATIFGQIGVQYLSGLVGNVEIPKQDGSGQAYWVAEGNAPTEQSGSVTQLRLTPKTIGAFQDYSRLMMLQSEPTIERIVRGDILAIIARGVEKVLFHGSGSNNQPQGLQYNATVSASALLTGMANFTQTSSTDLEAVIAGNNYVGNLTYVMRPSFAVTLKSRPKIGTTFPEYIVDGNMRSGYTMNGYPVAVTNNILSGFMFLGDFSQALIGEWGTLDLTVDPYALSTSGGTRVIGLYNVDVAFRYTQAFTFGSPVS